MGKYLLNNGNRLVITQDEDPSDPRERSNIWKMRVQEHRYYTFPREMDYDLDDDNDKAILEKHYHVFMLDCYIHSTVHFSLRWAGMQCRFDTATDIWYIAVPKEMNSYDHRAWAMSTNQDKWEKIIHTAKQAMEIAEDELKIYNQYINWEVYACIIEQPVVWTSEHGARKTTWEYVDGCWGYYDIQDILEEHKLLDPKEID